jgi:hypothetical protein
MQLTSRSKEPPRLPFLRDAPRPRTSNGLKATPETKLGNEECDRLAKAGADKPTLDELNLEIPITFDLQGAKLSALTQALAYRGIMEKRPPCHRATTAENLHLTREAIQNYNGILETDETIWSGMRQRTLRTRVKQFLYKAMHGTQKIGHYWHHIPENEQREFCTTRGSTESMEHILVYCRASPRRRIWRLAKDLWPHATIPWPEITLGTILGSGTISTPKEEHQEEHNEQGNRTQRPTGRGAHRLLQILLSEAARLIWVLRCERVIEDPDHIHSEEIQARWHRAINIRLTEDKLNATKIKRHKQTIQIANETWKPILTKQHPYLPNDWVHIREVLVGRRT